jgi:4-amino-4-deoxy-L-arabinose transferase-like glycosyltransferase
MPPLPSVARPALVAGLGSAALTAAFLVLGPESLEPTPRNDYGQYYRPVAESLLRGEGYVRDGQVNLHNPPGYPFLLVVCFAFAAATGLSQAFWVGALAVACTSASTVLSYVIARRLLGGRTALVAAVLVATYPLTLVMASYRLSEAPYTTALLVVVYGAVRTASTAGRPLLWAGATGLACAVAALIRPAAIGLAVAVGFALLVRRSGPALRQRCAAALLVVAGFLVGVAPWQVWVYERTGKVVALSEVGPEAGVVGVIVGAREAVIETGDPVFVPRAVREMSARIFVDREELESSGDVVARLAEEPASSVALLVVSKAARAFFGTDSFKLEGLVLAVQLPYLALMAAGLAVVRRSGEPLTRWSAWLLLVLAAYSWVVTMSALSIVRYMAPVLAVLCIPAAAAVVHLWDRRRPAAAPDAVSVAGRPRPSG